MDETPRTVRPKLDRAGPLRAFSEMFRSAPPGNGNGHGEPQDDVVSRSVELGYRVVDDYLRSGQRTAERVGERSAAPAGGLRDFQDLAGRMARYASDLTEIWFQLMDLTTRSSAAASFGANGTAETATAPAAAASPVAEPDVARAGVHVAIEINSLQPVEISLDLRLGSTRSALVHALRAADPEKPRLTDVRLHLASGDDPTKLALSIPSDQPAGIYSGLVIDEQTSRPIGTISARVGAEPPIA
jgi:hypothetical protein